MRVANAAPRRRDFILVPSLYRRRKACFRSWRRMRKHRVFQHAQKLLVPWMGRASYKFVVEFVLREGSPVSDHVKRNLIRAIFDSETNEIRHFEKIARLHNHRKLQ